LSTMVLNTVPNQVRGIGVSLVSFCNMLIGLTLGTSMTAIFTDKVYRDPMAVGWSMTTVVVPAAALALLLFWRARRMVGRSSLLPLREKEGPRASAAKSRGG
jgi:sugar phosphate permease